MPRWTVTGNGYDEVRQAGSRAFYCVGLAAFAHFGFVLFAMTGHLVAAGISAYLFVACAGFMACGYYNAWQAWRNRSRGGEMSLKKPVGLGAAVGRAVGCGTLQQIALVLDPVEEKPVDEQKFRMWADFVARMKLYGGGTVTTLFMAWMFLSEMAFCEFIK